MDSELATDSSKLSSTSARCSGTGRRSMRVLSLTWCISGALEPLHCSAIIRPQACRQLADLERVFDFALAGFGSAVQFENLPAFQRGKGHSVAQQNPIRPDCSNSRAGSEDAGQV